MVALAAITMVLFATLRLPVANVAVQRRDTATVSLILNNRVTILPSAMPVTLTRADGVTMRLRADTLVDGITAHGDRAAKRAWRAQRRDIAAAFIDGTVTLRFPDGRTIHGFSRPRRIDDLTGGFWASLLTGFFGLLFGFWVVVMRPRNSAARIFAVMSLGLFGAGCTLAGGYDPLLLGDRYWTLMLLNHASVQTFGACILMLFCRFPLPIVEQRWLLVFPAAAIVLTMVDVFNFVHDTIWVAFTSITIEFVLFILLLVWQAWAARRDAAGRAAMRLIGVSAIFSSTLFVGLVVAPMLLNGAPLVSEAIALPLLLVIYAGLGAAILRTRLFTVDGWALGLLLSVCAAVGVIAIDLVILSLIAESRGIGLPIAVVTVGLVYLPLRQAIMHRADRRRDRALRRSLRLASEMAFALTPEDRADRWHATLAAIFNPLDIARDELPVDAPRLAEEGAAMRLPPIADTPGLVIRHAQGGSRDFDTLDLERATDIAEVVGKLIGARDSYVQGVTEERGRIAQDLHDDVGARLMTSLHRRDPAIMRNDVREALADIRTIVGGLVGGQRQLGDLMADLRHETTNRLQAHDIGIEWPSVPVEANDHLLEYATYRHLLSITREIVSNVIRHAGAKRVEVSVEIFADLLTIVIADDGCGFGDLRPAGNGLSNSAARSRQFGGSFEVRSDPNGTIARIEMPLPPGLPKSGYRRSVDERLAPAE